MMDRKRRATGSGQLRHLLVVEDNSGDIRLIEEAFEESRLDPTIHAVTTEESALDFLFRRGEYDDAPRPDVALLDWSLLETDGGEVLSDLETECPEMTVVVMTGSKARAEAIESEVSGADAYLPKPTDPDVYIETIRSLE